MTNRIEQSPFGNLFFPIIIFFLFSCEKQPENYRSAIDLSGTWQFSLDSSDLGIDQRWYTKELNDTISLPGTTDLNKKGYKNHDTTTMHLNRVYIYEGPAWYKKKINIPKKWSGQHIVLFMERTKPSKIWVDEQYIGESFLLESPQKYDLSKFLEPGEHTITIRIDNSLELTPYGNVHIYTDETQTNWNGMVGDIYLEASNKTYIKDIQVYPNIENQKIKVQLAIDNQLDLKKVDVELHITKESDGKNTRLNDAKFSVPCDSLIELEYELGKSMDLWDEYHQPIYTLNAVISDNGQIRDNKRVSFGMRSFKAKGTQFIINGRTTFLRGKHDACVFPLTGYPPMDTEGWIRVFEIARSYGINHYRFHSWCPPEAAFAAADRVGIYLQPELPFWGGLKSDTVAERLEQEGIALLKSYANHPSFVMFSPGNEIWGGHEKIKEIITELRHRDNRPLYTQGSNDNIGYVGPADYADFHIAARTPYAHDTVLTHTRLTQAYADSNEGGILNTQEPSTNVNFDYPVSQINVPLISHEIGQYQIYPDYAEIQKYTGVVRAWNLKVFRDRLKNAGMLNMDSAFHQASGAWSALCYKAEMEAALRTARLAGFQLLDLQDFPGQGTALVGILDAFMDSKNVVTREKWLESCNDVVTLLAFPKYCWTNEETFTAEVKVANYSNKPISNDLNWEVLDNNKNIIEQGEFSHPDIQMGKLNDIAQIQIPLSGIKVPQKLTINISIENTDYGNSYPVWVYPQPSGIDVSENEIEIATNLDQKVINRLQQGGKVLLLPEEASVKENSVGGLFPPDFWNYGMFKSISEWAKKPVSPGTLGILTDPEHPVFNDFPTEFHTNWQWWSIVRNSRPLILDKTKKDFRPIVQVIDNMERNHKLGLIFEFKVGEGKLLVCMSRLNKIQQRPEASQLFNSMLKYMRSDQFNPDYEIDQALLLSMFR